MAITPDLALSVRHSWIEAAAHLGGNRASAANSADDLVARYNQVHRRYHTLVHVAAVIHDGIELGGELGLQPAERSRLTLAAGAHDVVYDAQPGADERASSAWAGAALASAGLADADVTRVRRLVLMTLSHETESSDAAACVLLDADLAILGAEPGVYANYAAAVRQEYASVPDHQWRAGRSRVLEALAERERLYLTEPARQRWEAAARRNLAGELASLGP